MSSAGAGPRAVLAGHATFAEGMRAAVEQISGRGSVFATVSNTGLGAAELEHVVRAAVTAQQATVIFTDLPAGSCTIAARRVAKDQPALGVVAGANLALLLEFALAGESAAPDFERLTIKAREALRVFQTPATGA
jgi:PTS system N-acetylgalactosamine-specific IIA component